MVVGGESGLLGLPTGVAQLKIGEICSLTSSRSERDNHGGSGSTSVNRGCLFVCIRLYFDPHVF